MPALSRFVPALTFLAGGLACSDSGGPRVTGSAVAAYGGGG